MTPNSEIERLRELLEQAPIAIAVHKDFRIEYVNLAALELVGATDINQIVGRNPLDFIAPECAEAVRSRFESVMSSKRLPPTEEIIVRVDGSRVHVEVTAWSIPLHGGRAIQASLADLTQRRLATEALRDSEERLRTALAASGTGTFRWYVGTDQLEMGANLRKLCGLPAEDAVENLHTFIELVDPEDREEMAARFRNCATGPEDDSLAFRFRVLLPDGSVRWLDGKGKTFRDGAGAPTYVSGACVDITAQQQIDELILKRAQLAAFTADIGVALVEADTLAEILQRCAQTIVDRMGAAFARIWTLNEEENVM